MVNVIEHKDGQGNVDGEFVRKSDYDKVLAALHKITGAVPGGMYMPHVLFGAIAEARIAFPDDAGAKHGT